MRTLSIALIAGAVGCGGEAPVADPYKCIAAGGEACFELPTAKVDAAASTGASTNPILDCAPYEIVMSPGDVMINGGTTTFYGGNYIGAVRFEMFPSLNLTGQLVDVMSDDGTTNPDLTGSFTTMVSQLPSMVFWRTSKSTFLPLHFLYQRIDVSQPQIDMFNVSVATRIDISNLLENVTDQFLTGKSQVVGTAVDCNGNKLVNVVANVAPSTGRNGTRLFEEGVRTYYAMEEQDLRLGRRTMLMQTTTAGRFVISNLSPGHHFVQIWAFLTDADVAMGHMGLTLLGEQEIIVNTIETGIFVPIYGHI